MSTSNPDYVSPAYTEMEKRWKVCRLVRDINGSIESEPALILPKGDAEGEKSWETRRRLTFGFNALDETIHALTGLGTRHDPELQDDVPERIVAEWEDIDLQGTHGAVFAQHCVDFALQDGHGGILVDHPKTTPGLTLEQEKQLGVRAYFVLVPIDRITTWKTGRIGGRLVITMLKLYEPIDQDDGDFGTTTVDRWRTLTQRVAKQGHPTRAEGDLYVSFVVHEKVTSTAGVAFKVVDEGEMSGPRWIPFYPFYGGEKAGILQSRPPMWGLANSNLEHTQVRSERRYSLHKTAIAMPVWIGRKGAGANDTVVFSSDLGVDIDVGGDAKFMEGAGAALEPLLKETQDIERRMGSQGYSMLRRESQSQQTLGEKEMQAAREESKLARCIRSVKDAIESGFGAMAEFYNIKTGGGSVEMTQNFNDVSLSADEMRFLNELEDGGKLTLPTLLQQLQAGGRILQGVDLEKEVQAVEHQNAQEEDDGLSGTIKPKVDEEGKPVEEQLAA